MGVYPKGRKPLEIAYDADVALLDLALTKTWTVAQEGCKDWTAQDHGGRLAS